MKGMTSGLGSVVFLPFSPLDVLIFRVVGQPKTSTVVLASDETGMKLGQRINVWWELVY